MKIVHAPSAGAKSFIRVAERHIEAHEYDLAMKDLVAAQRTDPDNIYIHAIVERVHRLAADESSGKRFLGVTVGDAYDTGIKPAGDERASQEELDARIKKLTNTASLLLRRGAIETAFDSLMNAYLLDPMSPHVVETERTLLPVIELMRRRGTITRGSQTMNTFPMPPPSGRRADATPLSAEDARRIEELKSQKEQQRIESERAVWRQASRPPRVTDDHANPDPVKDHGETSPAPVPEKEPTGFFAKLRQGRFLG